MSNSNIVPPGSPFYSQAIAAASLKNRNHHQAAEEAETTTNNNDDDGGENSSHNNNNNNHSWTCTCGNVIHTSKKRCGACYKWRNGKRDNMKGIRSKTNARYADGMLHNHDDDAAAVAALGGSSSANGGAWTCCDEVKPSNQLRCGQCHKWRGGAAHAAASASNSNNNNNNNNNNESGRRKKKRRRKNAPSKGGEGSAAAVAAAAAARASLLLFEPPTAEEMSRERINKAIGQIKVQIDPATMAHLTAANRDIEVLNLTQLHHETIRLKERLKSVEARMEHLVKTKTMVRKRCSADGCNNLAQRKGLCYRHTPGGNKPKYCKYEGGCTNQRQGAGGFCYRHGAKYKKCKVDGCTSKIQQGGLCFKHGAKRGTGVKRKNVNTMEDEEQQHQQQQTQEEQQLLMEQQELQEGGGGGYLTHGLASNLL